MKSGRRTTVFGHPLRDALLGLIDRDGTTTSTIAAGELGESSGACSFHLRRLEALGLIEPAPSVGRVKPWRRVSARVDSTLNRELEDVAYASWLETRKASDTVEDFAFSEVVALSEGQLVDLRARLNQVIRSFTPAPDATDTAVIIRAFPMR
ncbi:winged helix-turn-helix domain-containing protein [Kribbella sp. NPDC051952]|uniref:winged helix-turn-helix domain-containing protein n=1 Tax=Kribbella sp. NPDC051952 TaxID=3154851 RepID=UPI003440D859